LSKRKAATTPSGRATGSTAELSGLESLFPGPLVLPGDGLAIDPKEPPQSLRSWIGEKVRNPVTQRRKTIYVVPPPHISGPPAFSVSVKGWTIPHVLKATSQGRCDPPDPDQVRQYLEAFYHPLPVKFWPGEVCFVPWTDDDPIEPRPKGSKGTPQIKYIGLQMGDGITRITTRWCPDEAYPRQLSLNDLLDAAIEALPVDAYALVMLTHHDLYEDEEDDFCCGRAYGSSRVGVVSAARYHPVLDKSVGIDREHMWPFSHCAEYVERLCREHDEEVGVATSKKRRKTAPPPPVEAATEEERQQQRAMADVVRAGLAAPDPQTNPTGLWLSRLARTVAHELGHCFCLAHCSYYACVMQGTGGIVEDLRQPPSLCLVCLAKLTRAVRDVVKGFDETQWLVERYTTLARFCERWERVAMFAAYRCWLEKRIEMLNAVPAAK
jgi:archaemetzincin